MAKNDGPSRRRGRPPTVVGKATESSMRFGDPERHAMARYRARVKQPDLPDAECVRQIMAEWLERELGEGGRRPRGADSMKRVTVRLFDVNEGQS